MLWALIPAQGLFLAHGFAVQASTKGSGSPSLGQAVSAVDNMPWQLPCDQGHTEKAGFPGGSH